MLIESVLNRKPKQFAKIFEEKLAEKVAQALDVLFVTEGKKLLLGKVEEDDIEEGDSNGSNVAHNRKIRKTIKKGPNGEKTYNGPQARYHMDRSLDRKNANKNVQTPKTTKLSKIDALKAKLRQRKNSAKYHDRGVEMHESVELDETRIKVKNPSKSKLKAVHDKLEKTGHVIQHGLEKANKSKWTYAKKTDKHDFFGGGKKVKVFHKGRHENLPEQDLDEGSLLLKQNRRAKRSDRALQKGAVRGDSTETLKGYRAKTKHHNLGTVNRFRANTGQKPLGKVSKYRDKINALKAKNPKRLPEEEFSEDHSLKPSSSQKLARRTRNNEIRKFNELGGAKDSPSNIQQRYRKDIIKSKLAVIKLKRERDGR
jgi:hypothetical protein